MSQFYDQASLVMVPSGYKAGKVYSQKPLSTDGELTFTRNSNATRVNADGLVEKVRQNLVLQSSNFGTTWVLNGTSRTDTGTTLNGEAVWEIFGSGGIYQSVGSTSGTVYSSSIYVKPNTATQVQLRYGGTISKNAFFDFSTNSFYGVTVAETYAEELADGWWRLTIQEPANANSIDFAIYSLPSASVYISSAQVEVSDFGPTQYIPTTSAAVSVGPTANVPRLDYSGGCPALKLEPQRSNLVRWSEQIDNTGGWQVSAATVAPNQTTSPDGYQNADEVTVTNNGGGIYSNDIAVSSSTAYTFSFYAKQGTATQSYLAIRDQTNAAFIDVDIQYTATNTEWTRVTHTFTTPATCTSVRCYLQRYSGGGQGTHYFWGAQLEASSYVGSYIGPTLGASVTRLADAAYKTGISSLINSTEGVLFFEMEALADDLTYRGISLSDGTFNNLVQIRFQNTSNSIAAQCRVSNSNEALITAPFTTTQKNKIAFRYKQNDFALFINGELKGTDTSGSTFTANTLTTLRTNRGDGSDIFYGELSQALILPALTNAQLAELTTL